MKYNKALRKRKILKVQEDYPFRYTWIKKGKGFIIAISNALSYAGIKNDN